jgi:hypothetical protein
MASDMRRRGLPYHRRMALIGWDRWLDRYLDDPVGYGALPQKMRFSAHVERRSEQRDRRIRDLPLLGRESRRSGPASRRR